MEPATTTAITTSQEGSLKPFTEASPTNNKTANLKPRTAVMEAVEDILYGSIAGIVGKYIEYPFDTVKVRLQSQPDHLPLRYNGPWDCFGQSIRSDGFLGLYRGISAPLFGAALENSSLFFWERLGRAALYASGYTPREQPLPLSALWLTGAFSGAMTSFVLTPVELVKCKIQVPDTGETGAVEEAAGKPKPTALRPLPVIRDIWRHQGLRGFWHGQLGTLIRESGGCAAWFGSKETVTKLMREWNGRRSGEEGETTKIRHHDSSPDDDSLPLWQQAVAGASAGMMYNFLFFPADTVKSRMQTTPIGEGAATEYRSFSAETAALWKQAGIKGFYRGCGITVMRSVPSSAFIFIVYDGLKKYFPLQ